MVLYNVCSYCLHSQRPSAFLYPEAINTNLQPDITGEKIEEEKNNLEDSAGGTNANISGYKTAPTAKHNEW